MSRASPVCVETNGLTCQVTLSGGGNKSPYFNNQNRITVTSSHIQDGWGGQGNSDALPGFFGIDSSWYLLRGDSPCVDSGDRNLPDDPDGTRNDRGWIHFPNDALDNLRIDTLSVDITTEEHRTLSIRYRNDTEVPVYATPMERWQAGDPEEMIDVTAITDDSEIHAVAWTENGYILSGGNSGNTPNQIYCLDRDFELTDQYNQPGEPYAECIWDLAGDGIDFLYGSFGNLIVAFMADGELGDIYAGPGGFQVSRGIGADFTFCEGFADIYIGGEEGVIECTDEEIRYQQRFQVGYPIESIGVKGNTRAVYVLTEPYSSYYLLSHLPL
ncbi:MAG: hypothetical protein P9X24_16220 [Candidatus Hatepunaea meridiana]|nr:hypothetical protein [Candidatus Hatepunaea meridiana]